MNDEEREGHKRLGQFDTVGLCRICLHVKVINTPRGSTFYLCCLSETDPRFEKYPRLPVIRCAGYEQKSSKRPAT